MLLKERTEISKDVHQPSRNFPKNTNCTQGSRAGRPAFMGKQAEPQGEGIVSPQGIQAWHSL